MASQTQPKRILVTLATGKQGSGVVKALAERNKTGSMKYEILAVTRNASSSKATALAKLPGVLALESDYEPSTIFEKAESLGTGGAVYGVFSVQQSFDNPAGGIKGEEEQGKKMADEAAKHDVKHFIYSSVDMGGQADTAVPHFESKRRVEEYIGSKYPSLPVTTLRPVFFMDNISSGDTFMGKMSNTVFSVGLKRPVQLIACSDIGQFAALAIDSPEKFIGQKLSLAGDEQDFNGFQNAFQAVKGEKLPTTFGFLGKGVLFGVKEMGSMFRWFNDVGYKADILNLREMNPKMKNLKQFFETEL